MFEDQVRGALLEDLGRAGDITTAATIPPAAMARAVISSREPGVICGIDAAATAFRLLDPTMVFVPLVADGAKVTPGELIARIGGNARAMLSAERVALNFLMHLSGISTLTAAYAARVAHTKAKVCDTRKTMPGLRALAKYAVRCGGGSNHRYGLDDAILIKDNHVAVAGGVAKAVHAARAYAGHLVRIEVEVDTIGQIGEAMDAGADVILLDNMPPQVLIQAVEMNAGSAILEASGRISLDTIAAVAETGVDYISTSKITMAAPTLDVGLDIEIE
jgi:nicotinate-nucleotide pyrophosphorylase (carboxylating)